MAEFFLMPAASPTMEVGRLVEWRVSEGDSVSPQDILAEVETDKATAEIEIFDPGVVLKILQKVGAEVAVNAPIAILGEAGEDITDLLTQFEQMDDAKPQVQAPSEPPSATDHKVKAGPAARLAADEHGIDLSEVKGSGPGGRVMRGDVVASLSLEDAGIEWLEWHGKELHGSIMEDPLGFKPATAIPLRRGIASGDGQAKTSDEVIGNSMMRKTIAKRLKSSYLDAPAFFLNARFNCGEMVAFRAQLKAAGVKVSYNDIVVKAVAKSLRDVPAVNASWGEDAITRHGQVNVGIAVALPEGLITPVLVNADMKGLSVIAAETRDLAERARSNALKPEEYQGSTFTISNLGMMQIEHFTAIINPPNSAILAVGALQQEPMVNNGELIVGWQMKVTMTCDHRVIDGALGASFLQALRRYIENPALLAT